MERNSKLIINDNIIINKNNNIINIEFKYPCYSLINSLLKTRLIVGGSTDEFYKTLTFKSDSIKTLNQQLNDNTKNKGKRNLLITEVANAIQCLGKQLDYLINKEFKTILGYNPDDIIIINDEIFIFLNNDLVTDIDQDTEKITISWPFCANDFFVSPELLKIKEIPSQIHFKSVYFSFACLIIYFLLGDDDFYKNYLKTKDPKEVLFGLDNHFIKRTKLYWFLSRCLIADVEERCLLII
jgi:hypothetical protein